MVFCHLNKSLCTFYPYRREFCSFLTVEMYLEGLDEGPEQCPYALTTTQQLHQTHHTEQTEEVNADNRRPRRLKN